jgi:hypothetical protein
MAKNGRGLVGSSCGLTVMLGGFQAVRIDCWLVLPTTKKKLKQTYRKCSEFVHDKVRGEVVKIYERNQQVQGDMQDGE